MRGLEVYEHDARLPIIEASLQRKREFVEEFFTTGDMGVAYIRAIDNNCARGSARDKALNLLETDKFIRDLMALARKNVIGSVTGLLAEHTSILAELRDEARADGKYAPAIAAEIARGKALGLYDRVAGDRTHEKDPTDMGTDEIRQMIEAVSRLPQTERDNIAKLLTSGSAGLLDEEIEAEAREITIGADSE